MSGAFAVLVITALLAACGGSGAGGAGGSGGSVAGAKGPTNSLVSCPSSTNTTAAAKESGTVTLTVSGWTSTPAEDALVQQGLNGFTQAHPNIKVTWNPIPTNYETKMRADVASGSVPDVFYVSPDMGQEYIPAGKLLNLSPYMARDNMSASAFYSSLMQPFDCANGTIYGVPKDWNSLGLFYNKALFQQAGLGDPSNWTWQDLTNAAQKLTTGNTVGIALPADASRWGAFLFANGGQMLSSNGKTAEFNNQAAVQAANWYTGLVTSHVGNMPVNLPGATWDGDAFGKGEAAMTFEGGWMIPYMQQSFPNLQYGIAPLPKAPTGKNDNLVYTNAWGASSSTKHPEAAWELIKYMTGATYQTQVLHDGFALPTLTSLANDTYFTQNPGVKMLQDGASNGHADFYGPADTEIHTQVSNALQAVMLGKGSVTSELNTAAQNVDTWIQQNEQP